MLLYHSKKLQLESRPSLHFLFSYNNKMQSVKKIIAQAKENYSKLSKPKTCTLAFYIDYWIKEIALRNSILKTIKKISPTDTNDPNYVFREYFSILPIDKILIVYREIVSASPYSKRVKTAEKYEIVLKKLEELFVKMIFVRNKTASVQKYDSYIDLILNKNKIPRSSFQKFIKNVDFLIDYLNKQLPRVSHLPNWFYSPFNLPCFLCQISFPNLNSPAKILDLVEKEYPPIKLFRHKITVYYGDKTQMFYKKETDSFKITLSKNYNKRHQALGLIHELGHVITMLEDFKNGKNPLELGKYKGEKSAIEFELKVLKFLSLKVFRAQLGDILSTFWRVLFEIAIYENPKQNFPQLYAKIFNRCFPQAKQKNNRLYLLDENIVLNPLSSLPHAISYAELLLDKYIRVSYEKI